MTAKQHLTMAIILVAIVTGIIAWSATVGFSTDPLSAPQEQPTILEGRTMNYGNMIKGLVWSAEHVDEIAADAEAGIHLIRRIADMCGYHNTTADEILMTADKAFKSLSDSADPNAE